MSWIVSVSSPETCGGLQECACRSSFLITSFVDGVVHRVDLAYCKELALHRIGRSGGSTLFWHEMVTSGLFGEMNELSLENQVNVPGGRFALAI
mmetsp:Transcript_20393/g.30238  ORF Transcript_20393/g.30238 Transcript_20393/m.30238 type:complete len:94 (-) Transcript_20393:293-574(-)